MKSYRIHSRSGFTLLEIMLVVVIIGMLITVAVVKLSGQSEKARLVATRHQIDAYKTALGLYDLDCGVFPPTELGLNALITQPPNLPNWKGPYLDPPVIRKDQWGRDYIYRYPGKKSRTVMTYYPLAPTAWKATRMILATGNERGRSGFTLIELSIALFIIAIIMAVSVPSFIRSYNASLIDSTGRTVITSCQFARLNAVLHQQKVEFYIDLDKQIMWLIQVDTNETDSAESNAQVLKTIEVPSRIGLVSAQVGDEPLQQKGQVAATFYPNGTCDAFQLTLRGTEKGSGLAIVVDPVTSRAVPWPVKL